MRKCNKTGHRYSCLSNFTLPIVTNINYYMQLYSIAGGDLHKVGGA